MMDDHFDAVLGTAPSRERFVASSRWAGAKPGYVFTTRHGATGYYVDDDDAAEPEEPAPKSARADEPESIEQILAKGDDADVQELDLEMTDDLDIAYDTEPLDEFLTGLGCRQYSGKRSRVWAKACTKLQVILARQSRLFASQPNHRRY